MRRRLPFAPSQAVYTDEEAAPGSMDILLEGGMPRSRTVVLNGAMKVGVQWEMGAEGIADLKAFFRVVSRTGEDFDALLPLDDGIMKPYQSRFVAGSFRTIAPSGWNGFVIAAQLWVIPQADPDTDADHVEMLTEFGPNWRYCLDEFDRIVNQDLPRILSGK